MWYAIYDVATGQLRSVGTVLTDPLPSGLAAVECGDSRPDGEWSSVTLEFVPRSPLPDRWTKYEFLMRMTAAERIAIRTAAASDPIVDDFMDMLNVSGEVVRSNPVVVQGLNYLVSQGCLAAGRPGEILNG